MGFTHEYTHTFTNVGAAYIEEQISVPYIGRISRVRIRVTGGTAINQARARVATVAGAAGFANKLEYALAAQPVDSEENPNIFYQVTQVAGTHYGVLFLAVSVDDATLDHTVEVELTIEGAGDQPVGFW